MHLNNDLKTNNDRTFDQPRSKKHLKVETSPEQSMLLTLMYYNYLVNLVESFTLRFYIHLIFVIILIYNGNENQSTINDQKGKLSGFLFLVKTKT